ncbi:sigma-54-dependent Fis family transcriptional regulator [Ruegeria atlantica]|uniref:sigma-54-dependent Fis family transcriptional regulator n=1 Tax=Ruegeria atlantica TaxID=81569 RepID=UPI00147ED94C|nr:sigma-54-dependent Fis family transcriptional regulator [Ruegeria atlantica]
MLDRQHTKEIDRVLSGFDTGRDRLVADSWQRCVETYGMDPSRQEPAHILPDTKFREHLEQSERLIATARSGLQSLFAQVAGQNYVLLLADADGVCVDFFGDRNFEDELRTAGLHLGFKWTEELAGTNGVGSCIVTGQPVTIHQGDHFSITHTPLSCTAAPIFDTKGGLAAVLDVSLLRGPSPKASQNLAMTLVTNSARRVEMANLMASTRRDWVLRFSASPEFLEVDPEAAVAVDGSGKIIGMTSGARRALDPDGSGHLIGSQLQDWLEISVDDMPEFMRGRPSEDRVLHLKDGRALYGHAVAPQTSQMTAALRKREQVLPGALGSFAGPDADLQQLLNNAARLAPTSLPLLLTGESGTGKTKLARAIHMADPARQDFHTVICCDTETFDFCQTIDPGTLFLRGVEDLSEPAQASLLAVLERRADLRIIASCRQPPAGLQGGLREDLLHRIAGATFSLPPLRHRADLDWLIDRLLRRFASHDIHLSTVARADLKSRLWSGNIRELEHLLHSAVALCQDNIIDLTDLPAPALAPAQKLDSDDLEALLRACDWNMSQVARRLGVNRSTILRRVRKAGLISPA